MIVVLRDVQIECHFSTTAVRQFQKVITDFVGFGNNTYLFVAWSPNCEPVKEAANSEDAPGRIILGTISYS